MSPIVTNAGCSCPLKDTPHADEHSILQAKPSVMGLRRSGTSIVPFPLVAELLSQSCVPYARSFSYRGRNEVWCAPVESRHPYPVSHCDVCSGLDATIDNMQACDSEVSSSDESMQDSLDGTFA